MARILYHDLCISATNITTFIDHTVGSRSAFRDIHLRSVKHIEFLDRSTTEEVQVIIQACPRIYSIEYPGIWPLDVILPNLRRITACIPSSSLDPRRLNYLRSDTVTHLRLENTRRTWPNAPDVGFWFPNLSHLGVSLLAKTDDEEMVDALLKEGTIMRRMEKITAYLQVPSHILAIRMDVPFEHHTDDQEWIESVMQGKENEKLVIEVENPPDSMVESAGEWFVWWHVDEPPRAPRKHPQDLWNQANRIVKCRHERKKALDFGECCYVAC